MTVYRVYSVRAGMSGQMTVDVPIAAVDMRGEKEAVVAYAWLQLMGKTELGADKKGEEAFPETRRILNEEIRSRYEHQRDEVYALFYEKIRYKIIRLKYT